MQLSLKFIKFIMYGCGQEHMYMYVSLDMSGLEHCGWLIGSAAPPATLPPRCRNALASLHAEGSGASHWVDGGLQAAGLQLQEERAHPCHDPLTGVLQRSSRM